MWKFRALLWRHYARYRIPQDHSRLARPKLRVPRHAEVGIASERQQNRILVQRIPGAPTATPEGFSTMEAHVDPSETASKPVGKDDLQTLPLVEVEKKLGSSPHGLTQSEAQKRLIQCGPNEIAEKKTNEILKFLSYFWGPIPWMIEAAVILWAAARHWPDFGIILLLLLANAIASLWAEARLRGSPWEGPECEPKPLFQCEHNCPFANITTST
jgi:magnesium-transporting ATPase (P-type)